MWLMPWISWAFGLQLLFLNIKCLFFGNIFELCSQSPDGSWMACSESPRNEFHYSFGLQYRNISLFRLLSAIPLGCSLQPGPVWWTDIQYQPNLERSEADVWKITVWNHILSIFKQKNVISKAFRHLEAWKYTLKLIFNADGIGASKHF